MSSRCSPCWLVRAVWCMFSSCGEETNIRIHGDEKSVVGFAWHLQGADWSKTDNVASREISCLWTPRARATDLGRGLNLCLVYTRTPCVPRNREHDKWSGGGSAKYAHVQKCEFGASIHGAPSGSGVIPVGRRKLACWGVDTCARDRARKNE